jgi:hypothetical protein
MQRITQIFAGVVILAGALPNSIPAQPKDPSGAIEYLRTIQVKHVKRSTGTYDYNAFTDANLEAFRNTKRAETAVQGVEKDAKFRAIVDSLALMGAAERRSALDAVRKAATPTFAECGGVQSDGSCQTDAGQMAERLIGAKFADKLEAALAARQR